MATLGTTFAGAAFAMGGKEKAKEQGPPINASSKDEEDFIQYVHSLFPMAQAATEHMHREFLKNNGEEQKAKQ